MIWQVCYDPFHFDHFIDLPMIPGPTLSKKPDVCGGQLRMFQPAALKMITPAHAEAGGLRRCRRHRLLQEFDETIRQTLVCIQHQNPLGLKGTDPKGCIPLRSIALKWMKEYMGSCLAGDPAGIIITSRVEYMNIRASDQRPKAAWEVSCFVMCENECGYHQAGVWV